MKKSDIIYFFTDRRKYTLKFAIAVNSHNFQEAVNSLAVSIPGDCPFIGYSSCNQLIWRFWEDEIVLKEHSKARKLKSKIATYAVYWWQNKFWSCDSYTMLLYDNNGYCWYSRYSLLNMSDFDFVGKKGFKISIVDRWNSDRTVIESSDHRWYRWSLYKLPLLEYSEISITTLFETQLY